MLKPVSNKTREVTSLNGLWRFAVDDSRMERPWTAKLPGTTECPVPSSYNDLFAASPIRDHVGTVWYQRDVRIPRGWDGQRMFIRIGAATHEAEVYLDEQLVASHIGGYTPFEVELPANTLSGDEFRLTIKVSNILTNTSIPPGKISTDELGDSTQTYWHDFFNYSGLSRDVLLCCCPPGRIDDITVTTDVRGSTGVVSVDVRTIMSEGMRTQTTIVDQDGVIISSQRGCGPIEIPGARLWQPGSPYLYTAHVELYHGDKVHDEYHLTVGIRTVRVEGHQFLINNVPFYFKGFGWHEDRPVRGKGHDSVWMVHDLELMRALGANSFRTAHYPYDEEVYEYADRHGWVVIDETPAVGLNLNIKGGIFGSEPLKTFGKDFANDETRNAHSRAITEMIQRDKNHPSVVMWCIANEPDAALDGAFEYFEPLTRTARQLDPTRPLIYTNMVKSQPETDLIATLFDVIGINRYYGWYTETGNLKLATHKLESELLRWGEKFNKPIVMCEYGADAVAGLHSMDGIPWSEEFQAKFLEAYHEVFDRLKFVQGEHPWAFADFSTGPVVFRADGNKKGIFTRDRKPKLAAGVLRTRWLGSL